jgi:endonuclease/exonuclease/phosphatase family metal-dependent hydrolase
VLLVWVLSGCGGATTTAAQPPTTQPDRPTRVASYNVHKCVRGRDGIIATLRKLEADIVLVQELDEPDGQYIANALGMRWVFARNHPRHANDRQGQGIFSIHGLAKARPIADRDDHNCGVAVDCVLNGKPVMLMSVHLIPTMRANLTDLRNSERWRGEQLEKIRKFWHDAGEPSLILGGDFNQLPIGRNYGLMTADLIDALAKLGKTGYTCNFNGLQSRVDYLLLSQDWHATDGQVVSSDASDHRPIWVSVEAAQPSTKPSRD